MDDLDLICFVGGAVLVADGVIKLVSSVAKVQSRFNRIFGPRVTVPETIMWGLGLIGLGVIRVLWRTETKRID